MIDQLPQARRAVILNGPVNRGQAVPRCSTGAGDGALDSFSWLVVCPTPPAGAAERHRPASVLPQPQISRRGINAIVRFAPRLSLVELMAMVAGVAGAIRLSVIARDAYLDHLAPYRIVVFDAAGRPTPPRATWAEGLADYRLSTSKMPGGGSPQQRGNSKV